MGSTKAFGMQINEGMEGITKENWMKKAYQDTREDGRKNGQNLRKID